MKIVICTDLNLDFIYGTFLEAVYHLEKKDPGSCIPCIIVGDRDEKKINAIVDLINSKIGIPRNKIIAYKGPKDILEKDETIIDKFSEEAAKELKSINDLHHLYYNEYQVGIPVLSSLITNIKSVILDIEEHREKIRLYIYYSLTTFQSFIDIKSKLPKEEEIEYYIYNGRTYNTYPISVLTPEDKTFYYERFDDRTKLRIQPHRMHDFEKNHKLIKNHWQSSSASPSEKINIAKSFFELNKNNRHTKKFSSKISLNEKIYGKKIIALFISSEDEFASLHPDINVNRVFKSQKDSLYFLCDWIKDKNDYLLVMRVHPHYEQKKKEDREFWNNFKSKNLLVIESYSTVDTYQLIKKSEKVLSYLSTTGIEATYLGTPSIVLGNSPYCKLDAVYEPKDVSELSSLLSKKISPKPKENCLPYGFFIKSFGVEFNFIKSLGLKEFSELNSLLEDHV